MTPRKLLLASIGLVVLSGCGFTHKQIILHPIEKSDITPMKKGVAYAPEKDGFFLSSLYVSEVMEAKVEAVKKEA